MEELNLHKNAQDRVEHLGHDFSALLILYAKALAFKDRADVVSGAHVEDAHGLLLTNRRRNWTRDMSKVAGGALFGAFLPNVVGAFNANDAIAMGVYALIGLVGAILIFWNIGE